MSATQKLQSQATPAPKSQHSAIVIGCGSIGERHLRCFLQTKRAQMTACDSNPTLLQRIADTYHVPTVTNWETAVDTGSFDVAVICTPANFHISMAVHLLKKGLHVLIEKPLSQSMAGVEELLALSKKPHPKVAVAYTLHSFPILQQAKTFLRSGELGEILQALVVTGSPFHLLRPAYPRTYYRSHATGGGGIQDAITHNVNWVESVLGPTDSVICDCAHLFLPEVEVEDTVHVATRHGKVLVSYALNQFQHPVETTYQFNGTGGSLKIELHNSRWGVFRKGATEWTWNPAAPVERDFYYIAQAESFLDQVDGKPQTLCTVEAAAATLRFNLAALASAKSGARMNCRDVPLTS